MIYSQITVYISYLFVGTAILFQNATANDLGDLSLFQAIGQTGVFGTLSVLAGKYLLTQKNKYQEKYHKEIEAKIKLLQDSNKEKEEMRKAHDLDKREIRKEYEDRIKELQQKLLPNTSK